MKTKALEIRDEGTSGESRGNCRVGLSADTCAGERTGRRLNDNQQPQLCPPCYMVFRDGGESQAADLLTLDDAMSDQKILPDAARDADYYRFLREPHTDWHVEHWNGNTWEVLRGADLDQMIRKTMTKRLT